MSSDKFRDRKFMLLLYPGEDEMMALTLNGLMVLNNEVEAKIYE